MASNAAPTNRKTAPFGTWESPITADMVASAGVGLGQMVVDGDSLYWAESRPLDRGRCVVIRLGPDGSTQDLTPPPFNVRTRVHEYGGGAFTVVDGTVYFTNFADQHVYRQKPGGQPEPFVTQENCRYADFAFDPKGNRLFAVQEDHGVAGVVNSLVTIDLCTGQIRTVATGNDFYSSPRVNPAGTRLAFLTWNHPNMPWDGTELRVLDLKCEDPADTSVPSTPGGSEISGVKSGASDHRQSRVVAGGKEESVFQPEWGPDGALYFASDRTNWWNIYRLDETGGGSALPGTSGTGAAVPLKPMDAETGSPQWVLGMSLYGFLADGRIACASMKDGTWRLGVLDPANDSLSTVCPEFTYVGEVRTSGNSVFVRAGSAARSPRIVRIDVPRSSSSGNAGDAALSALIPVVLRKSSETAIDPGYLSMPEPLDFPTEAGLTAHALFYRPRNQDWGAPAGERPPLIVKSHGGPTGAAESALSLQTQFWTSRGFAVVDVNYGGSAGYGREYRDRLKGNWGVVDVDDCVNAAEYLADQGLVDRRRMSITGGSAGGYTTLAALTFRCVFTAGACYYGVSDLEALATDTHKFESRYLDRLIGPYPATRELYYERSPIHFTDRLSAPMILFQGLEDKVVPPNQAEMMVQSLRDKGLPVAYLAFQGEGHGFRSAENIKKALLAHLYFLSRIYGFTPAGEIEEVRIENL